MVTKIFTDEVAVNLIENLIISFFQIDNNENYTVFLSFILLVILFCRSFLFFLVTLIINKYTLNEEFFLKSKIFTYINLISYEKYNDLGKNEFIATILNYSRQYRSNVLINIIKMATDISIILVIISYLFINYSKETLILILISFIIVIAISKVIKKKITLYGIEINNIYKNEISIANDYYTSFKLMRILNKNNFLFSKFFILFKKYKKNTIYNELINLIPRFLFEFSFYIVLFSIIFFSDNNQNYILQSMSAFFYAAMRIMPSLTLTTNSLIKLMKHNDTVTRLHKIIKHFEILKKDNEKITHNDQFKKIEYINLNFNYSSDKKLFSEINFEINNSDKIGIIGESGIGKSTFLNILVGLTQSQISKILVDSNQIDNERLIYLDLFYYLNQTHILFDESLETNITLEIDGEKIDYDKLNKCLKDCFLSEFIINLKEKIYLNLKNDNINLSGGQIQRILIARALYNNKQILLMDESTNAMDEELQQKITTNIFKYYKTVIISSHDKNFIFKNCNKVYTIKDKNLVSIK